MMQANERYNNKESEIHNTHKSALATLSSKKKKEISSVFTWEMIHFQRISLALIRSSFVHSYTKHIPVYFFELIRAEVKANVTEVVPRWFGFRNELETIVNE